jgi:TorA maturation chaperone TorD
MNDLDREHLIRDRAEAYRFLSKLFWGEPTRNIIDSLQKSSLADLWRSLSSDSSKALPSLTEEGVETLSCEFARLFLGPGPHTPPYESVHRNDLEGGGQLWGEATQRVKRFVEHCGLTLDSLAQGIPDHISIEFEFLSRLALAEADALQHEEMDKAREVYALQKRFFMEHLSVWTPEFCHKALEQKPHPFYEALLRVTLDFLETEQKFFQSST